MFEGGRPSNLEVLGFFTTHAEASSFTILIMSAENSHVAVGLGVMLGGIVLPVCVESVHTEEVFHLAMYVPKSSTVSSQK